MEFAVSNDSVKTMTVIANRCVRFAAIAFPRAMFDTRLLITDLISLLQDVRRPEGA